jgi:hypothetical protein
LENCWELPLFSEPSDIEMLRQILWKQLLLILQLWTDWRFRASQCSSLSAKKQGESHVNCKYHHAYIPLISILSP